MDVSAVSYVRKLNWYKVLDLRQSLTIAAAANSIIPVIKMK